MPVVLSVNEAARSVTVVDRALAAFLSEQLECSICSSIAWCAVQTDCLHIFCADCIKKVMTDRCPNCRRSPLTHRPLESTNPTLHKMLGNVLVECLMFAGTCPWRGEYSSAEAHLQTSCDEHRMRCTACGEVRSASNMSMHRQHECVAAPSICSACQLSVPRYEMDHHARVSCRMTVVRCAHFRRENVAAVSGANAAFACTQLVRRVDMCAHLSTECVDTRVMCWICKAEYARGHQAAHMLDAMAPHCDRLTADRKSAVDVRTAPTVIVLGTQFEYKPDESRVVMLRYDMERNLWTTMSAHDTCHHMDVCPREVSTDTDVMVRVNIDGSVTRMDTAIVTYDTLLAISSATLRAKYGGVCDRIHALSKTRALLIGGLVAVDTLDAKNNRSTKKNALNRCVTYDIDRDIVTPCAPMRHARVYASSVRVGDIVYVVGGTNCPDDLSTMGAMSATMEQYDIKSNKWSELPSHPTRVMGAPIVAAPYGLVLAGGYRALQPESDAKHPMRFSMSNAVTCYLFAQRAWRSEEWVLPRKMEDFGFVYWRSRFIVMGGLTEAHGGRSGTGTAICVMYDERTRTWSDLQQLPAPLAVRQASLACA